MIVDLVTEALSSNNLKPQTLAASTQGASFDMANAEVATLMSIAIGSVGANSTAITVQCEESDDGSTNWTAISGMSMSATTSNTRTLVRGLRSKRYARLNAITVTGTTPSFAISGDIFGTKKYTDTTGGYSNSPAA